MLSDLITFTQRTDIFVTPEMKQAWDQAAIDAAAAFALSQQNAGAITDLNGRMAQVEDSLFSEIHTNPFLVGFGTLSGIVLTYGIWNATLHRVEC